MTRLSRRSVLRGAGGVAVGLPWLEAMSPRRASAAGGPRRIVFFFFGNGVVTSQYTPTGSETNFNLSPILAPLEPLKKKLVVLQGITMESARNNPGNGHGVGISNLLVARKFIKERSTTAGDFGWGSGISIDQQIALRAGGTTRFPWLGFGISSQESYFRGNSLGYMSYSGPQKPIAAEDDPRKAFQRIFTDPAGAPTAQIDRQKSVLDFVRESYRLAAGKVGAADRERLTEHLEKVRDMERRLTLAGPAAPGCKVPAAPPPTVNPDKPRGSNYGLVGKLQMDLLAAALACDHARVATLVWHGASASAVPPGVESAEPNLHEVSHRTDAVSLAVLTKTQTWYMQQLAYLATALDKIPEGNGTVLDNTTILTVSEVSVGHNHSYRDMPFLLVGGCGGSIRTGRFLTGINRAHNDLYISLLHAMGIAENTFGDPTYVKGPIPGLVG